MTAMPDLRFLLSINSENTWSDLLATLMDADQATARRSADTSPHTASKRTPAPLPLSTLSAKASAHSKPTRRGNDLSRCRPRLPPGSRYRTVHPCRHRGRAQGKFRSRTSLLHLRKTLATQAPIRRQARTRHRAPPPQRRVSHPSSIRPFQRMWRQPHPQPPDRRVREALLAGCAHASALPATWSVREPGRPYRAMVDVWLPRR